MTSARTHHALGLVGCVGVILSVFACGEGGPPLPPRPSTQQCQPLGPDGPALTLAATGCFASVAELTPSADLIPYAPRAPLWTDGAEKTRFLSLPPGETLQWNGASFSLPEGSVLIKIFALDARVEGRRNTVRIEARFWVQGPRGGELFSYRFNESGTAATLIEESETIALEAADGVPIEYYVPSHQTCTACHGIEGQVLGLTPAQLDFAYDYGPSRAHQIGALQEIGALAEGEVDAPPLADPLGRDPLTIRARSWLHTNCAHCHQPGGYAPSAIGMDMRYDVPLAETGLCDPVRFGSFTRYYRLAPGFPDASAIVLRVEAEGFERMPPVGVSRVDLDGLQVVRDWIERLPDCE